MFSKFASDSKSRSKSPKEQRTLHRAGTDKDLRLRVTTGFTKLNPSRSGVGKLAAEKTINTKDNQREGCPKWQLNVRKHSDKNMVTKQEDQLKKIQREIQIQKPKIMKKRNQSYTQLQVKLVNLEEQLHSLKEVMVKLNRKSKSKSKNKGKKSNSLEHNKKQAIQEEQKQQQYIFHSDTIQKYVTQVKKSSKSAKKSRKQLTKNTQSSPPPSTSQLPYYTGRLLAAINIGETSDVQQHIVQSLTTINYMKKIKRPTEGEIEKLKVEITNANYIEGRKTIVLDLDQTLIHYNQADQSGDIFLPITFPSGQTVTAGIYIRPHARELLQKLADLFQIIIFTASHQCYVNVVLDYLDPHKRLITQRIYRDNCYQPVQGMYIKDLRVITNRSLANMVLVDNAPYSYYFQIDNGIPIVSYYNDKSDTQLLTLQRFLIEKILPACDVRDVLRKHLKLGRYEEFPNLTTLIESLYL